MSRFIGSAFIVLTVLCLSPDVEAVPSFTWTEPWNVTLLPNSPGPPGGAFFNVRSFGDQATEDGQISIRLQISPLPSLV